MMTLIYKLQFKIAMDKALLTNRVECLAHLDSLHIPYKVYEHVAVADMKEMKEHVKLEKSPLIKTLLWSDKKPNTHWMIIAEMETKPNKGKISF